MIVSGLLALALLGAAPRAPRDAGVHSPGGGERRADAGVADAGVPAKATLTQVWFNTAALRGPVLALAFSADASRLIVGSGDRMARVFDLKSGKLLSELKGASTPVAAVALSPDGARAAMGEQALAVHLYDAVTGKMEREFPHPDSVSSLAFSPDGALLAVGGHTGTGAVYRVADGKRVFDFSGRTAAFSADGKRLLTAVSVGSLRTWDVATGKQTAELKTPAHQPWALASRDLGTIASFNPGDKSLRLWDLAAGKLKGTLDGHEKGISSASLSGDGARAATASDDKTVRLWDVASRRQVGTKAIETLGFVALTPDGAHLVVGQGSQFTLYSVAW